jgi:Predicted integral membrane protein linked to a cation pump
MAESVEKRRPRISQSNKEAFRNPWVLGWIAAIALVMLVNVGFIVTAIVTNPGLVDKDYYRKGRDLEQEFVALQETRHRLGWKMKLDAAHKPHVNQPARYTFSVVDKAGVPVAGDRAVISAYRPSDASSDFEREMQQIAPGIYSVELTFPLKGIWDLTATLHKGTDALKITRRISVQAP